MRPWDRAVTHVSPGEGGGGSPGGSGAQGSQGSLLLQVSAVLLVATALLLVWVGWGSLRASSDPTVRSGLDYEVFLDAVSDLLAENGESTLLRLDEVRERLPGGRVIIFDTLAILADARAFPSFHRAGFLYDQVQDYNRFQRERLALAREDPVWWDRLRAFNPSIFRPERRPDGVRGVTRAPAAWSLRVRSPLEGEWRGEVQATDVVRSPGLMSPRARIPLRKPARLLLPVGERVQACEFVPSPPEVRVYCLSEERIAQATLRLGTGRKEDSWAVAGWADLRVDGRRLRSGPRR